jgi:hypothetical protein
MRPSKPMTILLAAIFAGAPAFAPAQQPPRRQSDLGLRMGSIEVNRGEKFAYSLCTGQALDPNPNYGATGGFGCTPANDTVRGQCPPYRFRVGTIQDGLNHHLPPGVFLEANGVLHGRISSLGVLTRPGGIVCVEDDCGSKPVCRQLELTPVKATVDTRSLTAGRATLAPVGAAAPPAQPPAQPAANPSAAAPATSTPVPAPVGAGDAGDTNAAGGGGGGAGTVLAGLGIAAAAVAGALLIPTGDDAGGGGGDSCGVTRSQCCSGGASGCGVQAQCQCPGGLRDGGICQAGSQCTNFFSSGRRICNGC